MNRILSCSSIEDCIRQYGNDADTCFVFPSRIACRLWMFKALGITGRPALPADMFTAWDAFKITCCSAQAAEKTPVSQMVRRLFAHHITERNAETPLFRSLIPVNYAAQSTVFAQWIAGILPQLDHWEKRFSTSGSAADAEAQDLLMLKDSYTAFLNNAALFEPSWVETSFTPHHKRYILCFRELMEDYQEYAALLETCPEVFFLDVPAFDTDQHPLVSFENMRVEIRNTALEIEALLNQGVSADSIALSVADIENAAPFIKREFRLRNIPVEFRLGFKLGEQQAGSLFRLLADCVQTHYSFESIKTLLLNPHIPWKNPEAIRHVINFGIRNNCLVSWQDGGVYRNVWLEAFKLPVIAHQERLAEETAERDAAKGWLTGFMRQLEQLVTAASFTEVQKQYFIFREQYIDAEGFSAGDNAVIGRCIAVLQSLIELEADFGPYLPKDPYHFFTAQLHHEIYVPQNTGTAVSIFPFRVAAASPFEHHFVLNCSQHAARVIYQKLPFLRKDTRDRLGVIETDATAAFLSAYTVYGRCRFSYAQRSAAGFTIGNGLFIRKEAPAETLSSDPLFAEYRFFNGSGSFPQTVYPVQRQGFDRFARIKPQRGFSYIHEGFDNRLPALSHRLSTRYENSFFKINQTELQLFSSCAVKWLYQRLLNVCRMETDAEIFNPRYTGTLTHSILEDVYRKIADEDTLFTASHLSVYQEWAAEAFDSHIGIQNDFRGPLARPFIESLKRRVLEDVFFVLDFDAKTLDGFKPCAIEKKLTYKEGGIQYEGIIDRIAYDPAETTTVIIDYKTGMPPSASAYNPDNMTDFQIPMYVYLVEQEQKQKQIEHALFLDLSRKKTCCIINPGTGIKSDTKNAQKRDDFERSMGCFKAAAAAFAAAAAGEQLQKQPAVGWTECRSCSFQAICRTAFIVGRC